MRLLLADVGGKKLGHDKRLGFMSKSAFGMSSASLRPRR